MHCSFGACNLAGTDISLGDVEDGFLSGTFTNLNLVHTRMFGAMAQWQGGQGGLWNPGKETYTVHVESSGQESRDWHRSLEAE